jgi:hypothetical protein
MHAAANSECAYLSVLPVLCDGAGLDAGFHSQSKSDGKEAGADRRKNSYPMPAIPW